MSYLSAPANLFTLILMARSRTRPGWQVSGTATAETGLPLEITATDTSNTGGIHTQVADRVCDGRLSSDQRSIQKWFNTVCFVQPAAGRLGSPAATS